MSAASPVVLLDTNVASYLFGGRPEARQYAPHCEGKRGLLAAQTVAELRVGAEFARWGRRKRGHLEEFIGQYRTIFPDHAILGAYVQIRSCALREARPLSVADSWIAATALAEGVTLLAHDRVFRQVRGLRLVCLAP